MVVPALAFALGGCSEGPGAPISSTADAGTAVSARPPSGGAPASSTSSTSSTRSVTASSGTATTPATMTAPTPAPTPATTAAPTPAATPAPTPATTAASTAPVPAGTTLPTTFTDVNATIKDPDLGHEIVVTRIARHLPWPPGYTASAAALELVAVEMRWTPGTTFTAPLRLQDFSVNTGSRLPNRPETLVNEALKQAAWPLLPDQLANGQNATGWVVFKVDPKDAPEMSLDYTRPTSQVVGSDQVFPSQVFSAPLVG